MEFYYAINDFDTVEKGRVRVIAEAIRMNTWWLVNVQLPRNKKVRSKKRIMEFPWDKELKPAQTYDEMLNMMKFIAAATSTNKSKRVRRIE